MRSLSFSCLVFIVILVTGCAGNAASQSITPTSVDATLISRGIEVYRANYCGTCHTLTAANTSGTFGPGHDDAATMAAEALVLASYSGHATTLMEYLRESIVNPQIFYTPGFEQTNHHMPAFGHLPEEDVAALVELLSHQRVSN